MPDLRERFRTKLKEIRSAKGITQQRLAEISSLSVRYIHQIESGTSWPTPETLEKLSQSLSVEPADFFPTNRVESATPSLDMLLEVIRQQEKRLEEVLALHASSRITPEWITRAESLDGTDWESVDLLMDELAPRTEAASEPEIKKAK